MNDDWAGQVGQILGKKYLVRRVLGAGGMGVVYEVEHVLTKRLGALKLLHQSVASEPRIVERFVREASAAGRIGSPHIVETWDAGELPTGEPYMIMELLEGSPVRDLIANRGRLCFAEAREIVLQAAAGLAAAHAAGIVHRDVKPENLFVCSGPPPLVKLIDFGISKFGAFAANHRLTVEGTPLGTPYYMSAEQVAGKSDVDARTDVYSLGVVLYECVTGRVPFDAGTLPALSIRIFQGRFTPARELAVDAPLGLDGVLARAMAVEPSQRYASMQAFRDAIEQLPLPLFDQTGELAGEAWAKAAMPEVTQPARLSVAVGRSASPPELRVVAPVTASRSQRLAVVVGICVALGAAAAAWLAMIPDPEPMPAAPRVEAAPPPRSPEVAPRTSVSSAARDVPEAEVPRVAAPSGVRRNPPASVRSAQPATRAARDGLSEQNPFEK
jgi:eukaryotic-like serine/threonine-protein kinase